MYEWSSKENGRTTNIYNTDGIVVAIFRITCSSGYSVTDTITITVEEFKNEEEETEEKEISEEADSLPSISVVFTLSLLSLVSICSRRN